LAQHGLSLSSYCPYRLIAFHAQQCAEKHLKAYLVFTGVDFPYTHNISRLLELCGEHAEWAEKLLDAEELSPFATTVRYPGEEEEVTEEEAIRAINLAAKVYDTVRQALTQAGIKIPRRP
jgi:HEPN domain-containing protein